VLPIVACALMLAACSLPSDDPSALSSVPATIGGVGVLPPPVTQPGTTLAPGPTTTGTTTTTTILPVGEQSIGELAGGNRVLMIGDSLLASVSKRYYNELCETLVPLDWELLVEAEVSRQIDFAGTVLDELGVDETDEITSPSGSPPTTAPSGPDRWDAGLIFLGTNYNRDALDYLKRLNRSVIRFGAVPVVLVNVTEYDPAMREVNKVIESIDELYDNVRVVDWRAATSADSPRSDDLLTADGIHLTDEGRLALASVIAAELGQAPASPGKCLEPVFVEDPVPLPDGSGGPSSVPTTRPSQSTTTTAGTTSSSSTTTTAPDGGGGDGGGGGGGGDGGGGGGDGGDGGDGGGGDPGGGG
jgi:nucleotide-binding universal stress UspA family protein